MGSQFAAAGATIEVEDQMPTVVCDPHRLRQAFENLLANALKYGCPADGNLHVTVGGELRGDEIILHVSDNGPGVPPEFRERIFGLFQRLETQADGTGVGLAIVKRVAEVHGGRAWVEDRPGRSGARFLLAFPAEVEPSRQRQAA